MDEEKTEEKNHQIKEGNLRCFPGFNVYCNKVISLLETSKTINLIIIIAHLQLMSEQLQVTQVIKVISSYCYFQVFFCIFHSFDYYHETM